jgi:hypothetical protein
VAIDSEAASKVLAHIDRDELARLGCDLTGIPSPTGHEKAIAEFILAWFQGNGLKAVRQQVERASKRNSHLTHLTLLNCLQQS